MKRLSSISLGLLLLLAAGGWSCSKIIDAAPKDVLTEQNMYRNVYDADAAVIGVYGKFMGLSERYVVLNELRGDLLTVTASSNDYLRQLDAHNVSADNPYANPRPFYEVILNCNDVMRNFDIMLRDKKLKVDEYNMRYSDIAALRCWTYLQLGIQFGNVPYVTDPLADASDINKVNTTTRIPLSQLLDSLVKTMEQLPYTQAYPSTASLVTTVDGYTTNRFFINKQIVLGQLYLWRGDYNKAAIAFKSVMEIGGTGQLYTNRITGASKGDNNDLAVGYVRYREEDETQLIDNNSQGWRSIFARNEDALFGYEWIWYLPFNQAFKPVDPFIDMFSNRGGSYLLKPSQLAMNNWNSQKQKNDFTYDARGPKFSYRMLDGQPVVMKYLYNYLSETGFTPVNLFQKSGRWHLYRAAQLHLEYAEAVNRDGGKHSYLAYALLNQGLTTIPNKITAEGTPYNFDARKTESPKYAADWCFNSGIRGRANLYSTPAPGVADSVNTIEDQLVTEAGLELAYEGTRWPDLVRVALHRNDPTYLADKIYQKLVVENNPQAAAVRNKLLNKDNWWLPFKWQ
ncbi:MAG: RagB/SusD family nutrient uptake outer membrane protein [Bacteroidetes bacterium]|nr:RagB/SusD family nutrient uptake outer membrane protein [Bacteroidota bacterium]